MSSLFDDTDDHLTHRTRRAEAAGYGPDSPSLESSPHDREVTLSTGLVLVLFFALALVCAVFFGFGYSIGHKSGMSAAAASNPANPAQDSDSSSAEASPASKPAPGSLAVQSIPAYQPQGASTSSSVPTGKAPVSAARPQAQPRDAETDTAATEPTPVTRPAPVVRTPPVASAQTATAAEPIASGTGTDAAPASYVQIAAVSHQEDADVLVSALRRRGYRVIQRNEPADRLIHVQIGPFTSRKDADVTRQKLLADGYNAFIK